MNQFEKSLHITFPNSIPSSPGSSWLARKNSKHTHQAGLVSKPWMYRRIICSKIVPDCRSHPQQPTRSYLFQSFLISLQFLHLLELFLHIHNKAPDGLTRESQTESLRYNHLPPAQKHLKLVLQSDVSLLSHMFFLKIMKNTRLSES